MIEVGSVSAGKTGGAFPSTAEDVAGAIEGMGIGDTGAVSKNETAVAAEAFSAAFPCGAEIADWLTDSLGVEEPTGGALNTRVTFP